MPPGHYTIKVRKGTRVLEFDHVNI
jgi:hypothetical protein